MASGSSLKFLTPGHVEVTQKSGPTRNRIAYTIEISNKRKNRKEFRIYES